LRHMKINRQEKHVIDMLSILKQVVLVVGDVFLERFSICCYVLIVSIRM
jgi:hypothetical protein